MNKIKPGHYTQNSYLISDWTDKNKYFVHYSMLKLYVRHGMIVDKIHELISFKQRKWLQKYVSSNTTFTYFEKEFYKLLNFAFFGKMLENMRDRFKIEFDKNSENDKIIKQQSKWTFHGIHKTYTNYDSYIFKQNDVFLDKPIYVGFAILNLSRLHMCESYYDKLLPCFGEKNIHCQNLVIVTKETPFIIKTNESIKIMRIDILINKENWYIDDNVLTRWGNEEFGVCISIQVRTSEGWKNFKEIVRHKTEKDICRIGTKHGIVDVTENHSLLDKNREISNPCDLMIGDEGLYNYIEVGDPQMIFGETINKFYNMEHLI